MIYDELEQRIYEPLKAKRAATEGSAEHRLAVREPAGLHSTYEMAGPIMEDLDPLEWGAMCPNPPVPDPEGKVLPLQSPRRRR